MASLVFCKPLLFITLSLAEQVPFPLCRAAQNLARQIQRERQDDMKIRITKWWLGAALCLMTAALQPAKADQWNKETRIQIDVPMEIPGKVLTPGTYVFKLLDSPSSRNIVVIYSEDANGKQTLVTTTFAIPAYRMDTPDKPVINLEERPAGTPEAIHTWFYPGDNSGWEFVYPKAGAAAGSREPS